MKIWALSVVVDTYHHIYFDRLKHRFHRGGATVGDLAVVTTEIDCNSETTGRRAKRMKIWALWGVVDTSQHVYYDHFRHWFFRGGATAAAATNTEIDCNSKTTGRRAKRMKIWALWEVVDTSQHIYYDHFRHWFYRVGVAAAQKLKLAVTLKRLAIERNGNKFGPSGSCP